MPMILSEFLTLRARTSAAMTYSRAEIGQPCLIPLVNLNISDLYPLLKIHDLLSEYKVLIHWTKVGLNPNFSKTLKRKFHSIVSNAFLKSRKPHSKKYHRATTLSINAESEKANALHMS